MAVETPLNNVIFTVLQYNLWHTSITVLKISIFGMIFPLLGGGGGIAFGLKKIYIPCAISEFPNPPWRLVANIIRISCHSCNFFSKLDMFCTEYVETQIATIY